jgi:hypothetical protein
MFGQQIDALHYHAVLFRQYSDHLTAFPFILFFARDHFYLIALFNSHLHFLFSYRKD